MRLRVAAAMTPSLVIVHSCRPCGGCASRTSAPAAHLCDGRVTHALGPILLQQAAGDLVRSLHGQVGMAGKHERLPRQQRERLHLRQTTQRHAASADQRHMQHEQKECLSQQHAINCSNLAAYSHITLCPHLVLRHLLAHDEHLVIPGHLLVHGCSAGTGVQSRRPAAGSAAVCAAAHSQAPMRSGTIHDQQAAALQVATAQAGAHPSSGHHGRSSARHGMSGRRLRRAPNPRWQSPRQRHTAACVWPLRALARQLPDSHHPHPLACVVAYVRSSAAGAAAASPCSGGGGAGHPWRQRRRSAPGGPG